MEPIPGPRGVPVLGNVFDVDSADPLGGFVRMAEQYGPIFKLSVPGGVRLLVSGPDLVDEVCDDARFDKKIGGGLSVLQRGPAGAGLFTAETDDPLWVRAHNVLMAPFSLQAMRDYMPKMLDVADQLMDKWARLNPGEEVDVAADMTRLTLDTIALCGFGYRFNSFYRESPHPFVDAMVRVLTESQSRARQAADPDPAAGARAAAVRRGRGVHERPRRRDHHRTPRRGRRRRHHRPAGPHAQRRRQGRRAPAGREHQGPVHHVPHRGPRDDRRACCRSRSTT